MPAVSQQEHPEAVLWVWLLIDAFNVWFCVEYWASTCLGQLGLGHFITDSDCK